MRDRIADFINRHHIKGTVKLATNNEYLHPSSHTFKAVLRHKGKQRTFYVPTGWGWDEYPLDMVLGQLAEDYDYGAYENAGQFIRETEYDKELGYEFCVTWFEQELEPNARKLYELLGDDLLEELIGR